MKGFPPDNAPEPLPADADAWYELRVGLPRPDWTKIGDWIDGHIAKDQRDLAWYQAASDWLERLAAALGGQYCVHESPIFLMLMSGPDEQAEAMLRLLEGERKRICLLLGEAAREDYMGKPVAIVMAQEDDFQTYISDCYPPEWGIIHCQPVFISAGYGHIVLPAGDPEKLRESVAQETVRHCLMHLSLPLWLREGLAIALGTSTPYYTFAGWRPLSGPNFVDTIERVRKQFDSATIQQFWSGETFSTPDPEVRHFIYILAAELTRKLSRRRGFNHFVLKADESDAGLVAADILGVDLGQAVAEFLGPGDWRPRPETWKSNTSVENPRHFPPVK